MSIEYADTDGGFAIIPYHVQDDDRLSGNAVLVMLALVRHADRAGRATPSHSRISRLSRLSPSSVQRALAELEELGYVSKEIRYSTADGRQTSNSYLVNLFDRGYGHGDRGGYSERQGGVVTVTDKQEPLNKNHLTRYKPLPQSEDSGFDELWRIWPKRVSKKHAYTEYVKAVASHGSEVVDAGIRAWGEAYSRSREAKYVPALNVWLKREDFLIPPSEDLRQQRPGLDRVAAALDAGTRVQEEFHGGDLFGLQGSRQILG